MIVRSSPDPNDLKRLVEARRRCAAKILELYKMAGAGHIGSSLSCLEILVDLCFGRMEKDDVLVLSKGHADRNNGDWTERRSGFLPLFLA
jgi:transketolase N-terminal domain/subunit